MMSARRIGAAVVIDPEHAGIGILTERDLLDSIAAGEDPDAELVASTAPSTWCTPARLDARRRRRGDGPGRVQAPGGGRDRDVAGLLSMRDIVRCSTRPTRHRPARQHPGLSR